MIGIGNMGSGMASCLLRAGHSLLVYDRNPAAVGKLVEEGARAAGSPREIAETPGRFTNAQSCAVHAVLYACRSGTALARRRSPSPPPARPPPPATSGVSAVLTMLPSTEHVRDAYEGPDGVLRAAMLQPPLLVDSSTISPL
jgi:3-hydroxyisobutyrate dehydrogenase-like beta-hydroxyacid dehydrogenase